MCIYRAPVSKRLWWVARLSAPLLAVLGCSAELDYHGLLLAGPPCSDPPLYFFPSVFQGLLGTLLDFKVCLPFSFARSLQAVLLKARLMQSSSVLAFQGWLRLSNYCTSLLPALPLYL
jgi:hypothetical protein